jgi:hypothetical protein
MLALLFLIGYKITVLPGPRLGFCGGLHWIWCKSSIKLGLGAS